MRFSPTSHPCDGGLDRHARSLSGWILTQEGEIMLHRPMHASPDAFLNAIAPSREDVVVAVDGICPWSWLADLCRREGRACVLGQALDRNALPGGNAPQEQGEAPHSAVRLRGGMLPHASG